MSKKRMNGNGLSKKVIKQKPKDNVEGKVEEKVEEKEKG